MVPPRRWHLALGGGRGGGGGGETLRRRSHLLLASGQELRLQRPVTLNSLRQNVWVPPAALFVRAL